MEHAVMCPQCNAPLAPRRFASSTVCPYCGTTVQLDETAVSAAAFHEAFRVWNAPESYHFSSWISIGSRHWALEKQIGQGDTADVYAARLARWPTELAVVKILRDRQDSGPFENEWAALQMLHKSEAPGADAFSMLLPQPILHGDITGAAFSGRRASIFRWAGGFEHNFAEVIRAYPQGIPPRASIWVWRRILETLSFIHASGMAHGALLPAHLLVQKNDHGVRLIGYSAAGRLKQELVRISSPASEAFYPKPAPAWSTLSAQLDVVMSARCIAAILGGDPETGALPEAVPARLAEMVQRIALAEPGGAAAQNAWVLREDLGWLAKEIYGPSQFIPIEMP